MFDEDGWGGESGRLRVTDLLIRLVGSLGEDSSFTSCIIFSGGIAILIKSYRFTVVCLAIKSENGHFRLDFPLQYSHLSTCSLILNR